MITQSLYVCLLLFCLYTTSEQILKYDHQNSNSINNLHRQGQHTVYRPLSWLAEHANFEHKHQKHFKASQSTALETVANQAAVSKIEASHYAAPEIVENQATIPEIDARQAANPKIMPSKTVAPEIVASKGVASEIMANKARTPEIVAIQATTLKIASSKTETPEIAAGEVGATEVVASQAKSTELKKTQAVISKLGWTQNVLTHFTTQYNTSKRKALTDVTVTPGKNAPNDFPCKNRAIKDKPSELNTKYKCSINTTDKTSNASERSNTYTEFKPQYDMTSEQNITQQALTNLVDLNSESNTTHGNVQLTLNQESRSKFKAKKKWTNNHKEIHIQESSSKHTIENALHSNTETVNAINERMSGYRTQQLLSTTSKRILANRGTNIPALNHDLNILPESSMNENTSDTKYSNCTLLIENKSVTLMCRNLSLTYIPKTVQKIDNIIFEYNNITNVTIETFSNISEPEYLKGLALNYDQIHNISSNALDKFVNLVYLHLSGNPFDYNNLKNLLGAVSKLGSLRYLRMEDVYTITIQYDLFSLMAGTKIDFLILKRYNLGSFSLDIFKHFSHLRKLVLSHNNITDIQLYKFWHMYELYIDRNLFRTVPNFCYTSGNLSVPYFPRLYQLSLKNNRIIEVKRESFKCLPTVKRLQLGMNYLSVLPNNFLGYMPKLYYLEIKNENGRFIKIEPFAFRSNSLGDLRIGYNADALSIFSSLNDTFKSAPNIKVLKIDYISLLHLTNENIKQLFGPLKHLLYLRCFACQILFDPKVILVNKPDLNNLDLGSNLIQTLSKDTFAHNKKLKILKMRYNKIGHLQESALPMTLLNNLEKFDLSANPFTCVCNLQWFFEWLKTSMKTGKNVTQHYPDGYVCSNPADKANMKISEVNFSYGECHPWSPGIWFAVVGCPCIVVIGIISLIVYRNRWNMKHYIYLLRKRRNYQLINGQNYEYDAFVGYETDDSAWVRRNLLPALEDGEGLKLCIHERDFVAGNFINDNIVRSMEKSKKIIFILTNSFARSDWCMYELKVAHSMLIENKTNVVIIVLEKIDARNMNHSLKLLFETTTYIEWTEDPVGRELFWNKLKDAVKN